ncbi:MAG: tRNA-dihydrouridine synthase, partial [Planctomycetes bacterium]|nr:tRNA-dihydrouridine synthase [Planctomycetota bacterium]
EDWGVDHIDLSFGCPVRKVTASGGGSAVPARPRLLARLLRAVVQAAGDTPVTIKFRKGIDDDVLTFLDAGRVAEQEGCRAVALHGRTAAQLYSGDADWSSIAELKHAVTTIPVLGNGDVFEACDALRMMRATGCDGVVVGRGCLGRPWLFRELVDAFAGREPPPPPNLGAVAAIARRHAELLVGFFGEPVALHQMRKHLGWYTKSFPGLSHSRARLQQVSTLAELDELLAALPADLPFPGPGLRARRCKSGGTQRVSLPPGYLDDRDDDRPLFPDPLDAGSGG